VASEEACDDWAIATGSDPVELAETMTNWMGLRAPAFAAGTIGMSSSKRRVLRLLAMRKTPDVKLSLGLRGATFVFALLIVAVAAVAQPTAEKPSTNTQAKTSKTAIPSELHRSALPQYVIEPPDVLQVELIRAIPNDPVRIEHRDKLTINVIGTLLGQDIQGTFPVDSAGEVSLGPAYGRLKVSGLTRPEAEEAVHKFLRRVLRDPDIELQIDESRVGAGVTGQHRVGPDGFINLGIYGNVSVTGLTLRAAKKAIEKKLAQHFRDPIVSVDIHAYHSKNYYVIVQGFDSLDGITRVPITGNETVLDALAQVAGLPLRTNAKTWIARPVPGGKSEDVKLPIFVDKIMSGANPSLNYQVFPNDRVFVVVEKKSKDKE